MVPVQPLEPGEEPANEAGRLMRKERVGEDAFRVCSSRLGQSLSSFNHGRWPGDMHAEAFKSRKVGSDRLMDEAKPARSWFVWLGQDRDHRQADMPTRELVPLFKSTEISFRASSKVEMDGSVRCLPQTFKDDGSDRGKPYTTCNRYQGQAARA